MQERKGRRGREVNLCTFDTCLSIDKFEATKEYQYVKEEFVYSYEWFKALFKSTRQRIITREKKKVVENSVENALYETYIVSIQVYGYMCTLLLESVLSASCNTDGNKARKRFSAASWRCFNAMKTVSALPPEEKRNVSLSARPFPRQNLSTSPKEVSAMELKGLRETKNVLLVFSILCWIIRHSASLRFASTYGVKICDKNIYIHICRYEIYEWV